jgi:hypothetical protein
MNVILTPVVADGYFDRLLRNETITGFVACYYAKLL